MEDFQNTTELLTDTPETNQDPRSATRRQSTPNSDGDILAVITGVLERWDETLHPVAWMTKARLQTVANDYSTHLRNRNTTGASRGAITSELRSLDDEIDISLEFIKNRLAERLHSKSEAVARYREFGIVKERAYKLPASREHRAEALLMLIDALGVYQFQDTDYSVTYWTDIQTRYAALVAQARATDGQLSGKVGTLNALRSEARKFLSAFIFIIRGNYPDTWKHVLREHGYHKEKY